MVLVCMLFAWLEFFSQLSFCRLMKSLIELRNKFCTKMKTFVISLLVILCRMDGFTECASFTGAKDNSLTTSLFTGQVTSTGTLNTSVQVTTSTSDTTVSQDTASIAVGSTATGTSNSTTVSSTSTQSTSTHASTVNYTV